MLQLAPETEKDLWAFSRRLSTGQAASLMRCIERICVDPSGRREPRHDFTRRFANPARYLGRPLPAGVKVWEFKTSRYRGLFIVDEPYIIFLKVRGKRFMTADECPWH